MTHCLLYSILIPKSKRKQQPNRLHIQHAWQELQTFMSGIQVEHLNMLIKTTFIQGIEQRRFYTIHQQFFGLINFNRILSRQLHGRIHAVNYVRVFPKYGRGRFSAKQKPNRRSQYICFHVLICTCLVTTLFRVDQLIPNR